MMLQVHFGVPFLFQEEDVRRILQATSIFCMLASAFASTGYPNEINNLHFENVSQTSVDVVWTTVHPSTSQVLIARDTNYEPERWAPQVADPGLVTNHR